ncbi:MAG: hypothetical protein JXR23_08715 [Pontiellaceae bacterium]|nr:hypothetical protein [Pontiellaceae bacterium]
MKKNLLVVLLMCVTVGGNVLCAAQSESKGKPEKEIRIWTAASGETIEGEYARVSGNSVVIRLANNKTIDVPLSQLSDEDRIYVEYKNPPKLKIEYRNSFDKTMYIADPWFDDRGGGTSKPADLHHGSHLWSWSDSRGKETL